MELPSQSFEPQKRELRALEKMLKSTTFKVVTFARCNHVPTPFPSLFKSLLVFFSGSFMSSFSNCDTTSKTVNYFIFIIFTSI